jgi:hypothetical protein
MWGLPQVQLLMLIIQYPKISNKNSVVVVKAPKTTKTINMSIKEAIIVGTKEPPLVLKNSQEKFWN